MLLPYPSTYRSIRLPTYLPIVDICPHISLYIHKSTRFSHSPYQLYSISYLFFLHIHLSVYFYQTTYLSFCLSIFHLFVYLQSICVLSHPSLFQVTLSLLGVSKAVNWGRVIKLSDSRREEERGGRHLVMSQSLCDCTLLEHCAERKLGKNQS